MVIFEMPIKVSASRGCAHSCDVVGYYYRTTIRCVICGLTDDDYFVIERHMQCGEPSVPVEITHTNLIDH